MSLSSRRRWGLNPGENLCLSSIDPRKISYDGIVFVLSIDLLCHYLLDPSLHFELILFFEGIDLDFYFNFDVICD